MSAHRSLIEKLYAFDSPVLDLAVVIFVVLVSVAAFVGIYSLIAAAL